MLQIERLTYNAFQVNTYLVWDEDGQCLVIDPAFTPGEETEAFDRTIREKNLTVTGQINTHCHVDHLLGVRYLEQQYGHTLRAHEGETRNLKNAHLMGEIFGLKLDPLEGIGRIIRDQETISLGQGSLMALHVPGHSPGSLAFYAVEDGFVVTGDALFQGSIGRTDLPGGDYDQLIESIRSRLLPLPPQTVVYPGHGPASTIGSEKEENPFLSMIQ
jgi:glyoxylase-like metal-dependent hydrolase (beta-lactamase superfamily II)